MNEFTKFQARAIDYAIGLFNKGIIGSCEFDYQHSKIVNADCSNTIEGIINALYASELA